MQDAFHLFPYRYVARFASSSTRVLEVGFGEGYGAEILDQFTGEYVGIDVSKDAVSHARARYGSSTVHFEQSDGTAIPFPSDSFDLVVSFHVLEHLREPGPYLAEMARVCRAGGRIAIVTPNRAFRLAPGERPWNRFHVREFDSVELTHLLSGTFQRFSIMGIAGDAAMNAVERARVARARRWARVDRFGLRYRLPEAVLLRIRRLLARVAARRNGTATDGTVSAAGVGCVDSDLDDAPHLLAVVEA